MSRLEPVIRASVFDGLPDFVATVATGIDLAVLLGEVGLDPSVLASPEVYVPLNPVSLLLERLAVQTGRPCFGLEFAQAYPIGASGSLGYLLANAPTMLEALENLVRYVRTFTHPMHVALRQEASGVAYIEWMFPLEFHAAMPQYVSFALGAVIERLRHVAGPRWVPLQVDLIHRELPCRDLYTAMFGPRVRFDAAHNRMWIDPTSMALRHERPDLRLYRTARLAGDTELDALAVTPLADVVIRLRAHIQRVMATGTVDLDGAAADLGLEPRALQYQLEQAGTSFSDELSRTRHMRAEHLLTATDQSMTEIAAALGFSELSSFTRACKESWFGMTPSRFRARARSEGLPPMATPEGRPGKNPPGDAGV